MYQVFFVAPSSPILWLPASVAKTTLLFPIFSHSLSIRFFDCEFDKRAIKHSVKWTVAGTWLSIDSPSYSSPLLKSRAKL